MRVVASFVILVGIFTACGGAAETNLFDEVPASASGSTGATGGSSGVSTSGASGVSSSGGASSGCAYEPCSGSSSGVIPRDGGVTEAGPPGPRKCSTSAPNTCLPGEYCKSELCDVTGVCTARPDPTLDLNPACGCDHVTYWNASVAASRGANIAGSGACGAAGTTCTRNTGCAGEAVCNLEQATFCAVTEVKGTCWQLPRTCEGTNTRQVRRCNNQQCTSLCSAIADERPFIPGTTCP